MRNERVEHAVRSNAIAIQNEIINEQQPTDEFCFLQNSFVVLLRGCKLPRRMREMKVYKGVAYRPYREKEGNALRVEALGWRK